MGAKLVRSGHELSSGMLLLDRLRAFGWTLPILIGFLALFVPTYIHLAATVWATDEQGHGPIILLVVIWLIWQRRQALNAVAPEPMTSVGVVVFLMASALYFVGRTQQLDTFEILAQILFTVAACLLIKGKTALKVLAFPIFFMLFMVPLPSILVQIVTTPLKQAVSYVAETILHFASYPVARSGVVISVGQYQLLVADACAGLNSMFTLEALGLLYMNLVGHTSLARNTILAILLVPVAFVANVIRVMILILVTYHFGDEAGQGFVHNLAGMVLFMVALVLMLMVDSILGLFFRKKKAASAQG